MVELQKTVEYSKDLSILYIDEDSSFLYSVSQSLSKIFAKVDDASDATIGLGYARLNQYDLIIMDAHSTIMSAQQLLTNIQKANPFQNVIITTHRSMTQEEILLLYALGVNAIIQKPLKMEILLETLSKVLAKISNERAYLSSTVDQLNETLTYERKRIGRFMMNEKKYTQRIQEYQNSIQVNRNIYELTRLPSRYALQNALSEQTQALLYLNIDHFDFVNSVYGMGKANKMLKECAARLKKFLPQNGELFHITADEFVILLDDPSEKQELLLAQQIQSMFEAAEVEFDTYTHRVHFSIGIDKGVGKILFANAKSASKESRCYGGNQITYFDSKSEYIQEQKENLYWIQTLKKAFEEDKIHTYYQAIKRSTTQEIKHYEVFCRLEDEQGNLIDAQKFIHSAKLIGLITHITKNVIDKAFKTFAHNEFHFSLNISMHDLHENYLVDFLKYKCEKYAIEPSRISIEILKDVILSKNKMIDEQILLLRELGFHITIDNFGSDALIYNRILELHVEYIKLDGELIKKLDTDKVHTIIVQSLIDFAKEGNIQIIAEHVESEEVYQKVCALGIEYVQGFAIAKPLLKLT